MKACEYLLCPLSKGQVEHLPFPLYYLVAWLSSDNYADNDLERKEVIRWTYLNEWTPQPPHHVRRTKRLTLHASSSGTCEMEIVNNGAGGAKPDWPAW